MGESTMNRRRSGLFTRIALCAESKVLRLWCAPHQINIVVKLADRSINDITFIKEVLSLYVYLQSQENLIITMGVKCPK